MKKVGLLLLIMVTAVAGFTLEMDWYELYGGEKYDYCRDHILTEDGGYALVGYTNSFDVRPTQIYLVKTDSEGNLEWQNTFGTDRFDRAYEIIETEDNGFLIFGYSYYEENHTRYGTIFIIKTDESGDSLWSKQYGGQYCEEVYAAIQVAEGGYALAGRTNSWGNGSYDFYFLRLDENCDSLWMKTYGTNGWEECNDIIQTMDGGFALTGFTSGWLNAPSSFLSIITDENGDSLWSIAATRNRQLHSQAQTIEQINDSTYVMAGGAEISNDNSDMWVIAFTNSEMVWNTVIGIDDHSKQENPLCSIKAFNDRLAFSGKFAVNQNVFTLIILTYSGEIVLKQFWESEELVICSSLLQNYDRSYSLAGSYNKRGIVEGRFVDTTDFFLLLTEQDSSFALVNQSDSTIPKLLSLEAYPNPFNGTLNININGPKTLFIEAIEFYSFAGRLVDKLPLLETTSSVMWSPNLPSGQYLIVVKAGKITASEKIVLIK